MANEIKSITHKVRNPRYDENNYIKNSTTNVNTTEDQRWLNIWSANFSNNDTYTITPSNNWSIPGNNISDNSIPSSKIISISGDKVSIGNPASSNVLVQTDSNGKLTDGPQINSSGSSTKFLNEKGEWYNASISGTNPISVNYNSNSGWTISHNTPVDNSQTDVILGMQLGNAVNDHPGDHPIIQIDSYGHTTRKNHIIIPLASSTSAGLAPATGSGSVNKILKIDNNGTISWADITDLRNDIPVASAWVDADNPGNGLVPGYHWTDTHLNGTFLGLDDSGVSWIAFTDDDYGVPLVSVYDKGAVPKFSSEGQILYVDKDDNDKLIPTWVTPKVTEVSKKLTDCFSYTPLNINEVADFVPINSEPSTPTEEYPAGMLTIDTTSFLTSATFSHQ